MSLATLSIDLIAKLGELQAGMDKAGQIAARAASQIEARYQRMASVAASVGAALGGALSIAGITTFLKSTIDGVDKLNDLSDATGASIENLSALEDIAARTGTSMETVGDAVIKLNKSLSSANPGSELEAAFKALGLSVTELKTLDPAEALRRVAVALSGFADDGNKARLVQELFGKSIKDVAPLLNDLARAGQLNATVTAEQAQAAEKFDHQLSALSKNATDAARAISGPLVEALNSFIDKVQRTDKAGGLFKYFGLEIDAALAGDKLAAVVDEMERLQSYMNKQGNPSAPLVLRMQQLRTEAATLTAQALKAAEALKAFAAVRDPDANVGGNDIRAARSRPGLPGTLGPPKKPEAPRVLAAAPLSEATRQALAAIEATDANKIREISAALDELFTMRAGGAGTGPDIDEAIEALRDNLAKLTPEGKAAAEAMGRLKSILEQTPGGQLAAVLKDIELLNKEFQNGAKDTESWADAIRVVTARLPGEVKPQIEEISEFAKQASRNIQDALGDTVLSVLEGKFGDIGSMWANLLRRMAAQAIAANIGSYLFGTGKGDDQGAIGGFIAGFFGGARATGGPVQAGRAYLVGERGPELMVPSSSGTVVPNNALGGNSTALTVINNVGAGVSRSDLVSALQASSRATESRIMQMLAVRRVI